MKTRNVVRRHLSKLATILMTAVALVTVAGSATAASKAPSNPAALKKSCSLWFNYTPHRPMDKAPGHSIVVQHTKGRTINYRYNWDSHYAVVSTWQPVIWGFMNRNCLAAPKHKVGGSLAEHLPTGVKKHTRWMCGQATLYVRDHQQRVIGRLYRGDRFIQYGKSRKMSKDHGRISVGYAYGHVDKPGRVYTKYLSSKPCPANSTTLASTAMTSTAASAQNNTVASASTTSCQYKVIWPAAGVYELPSNASILLKSKHAGDIVGGYCDVTYYNTTEGEEYFAVATASAQDGIGWMRRESVVKL
jgi:hypothetical protein